MTFGRSFQIYINNSKGWQMKLARKKLIFQFIIAMPIKAACLGGIAGIVIYFCLGFLGPETKPMQIVVALVLSVSIFLDSLVNGIRIVHKIDVSIDNESLILNNSLQSKANASEDKLVAAMRLVFGSFRASFTEMVAMLFYGILLPGIGVILFPFDLIISSNAPVPEFTVIYIAKAIFSCVQMAFSLFVFIVVSKHLGSSIVFNGEYAIEYGALGKPMAKVNFDEIVSIVEVKLCIVMRTKNDRIVFPYYRSLKDELCLTFIQRL
jgi:hypothetical protein